MPIAAKCPSCGAPLSEAAVVALAPVCLHCRSVLTNVGGTLGLTGAYGVGDPDITRRRIEADLSVLRQYQYNARGARLAFAEQLNWGVVRYAKLPAPPEMLALTTVPDIWGCFGFGLIASAVWFVVTSILAWLATVFSDGSTTEISPFFTLVIVAGYATCFSFTLVPYIGARVQNGTKPAENARRHEAHRRAIDAALKAAEPIKAAEDHRLREQIRKLEASEVVLGETADRVEQDLLKFKQGNSC